MMPSLLYPFREEIQRNRFKLFLLLTDQQGIGPLSARLAEDDVPVVNVGKEMANYLADKTAHIHIDMEAEDMLRGLLQLGKSKAAIALYNLGILLEPALQLNAARIIQDTSRERVVLILWDGGFEGERLFWDKNNTLPAFDFSGAGLKSITLPYEIQRTDPF